VLTLIVVGLTQLNLSAGEKDKTRDELLAAELQRGLTRVIRHPESWDEVQIEVGCTLDDDPQHLELFGIGIGIWRRSEQFSMRSEQFQEVLEAFDESGFVKWENQYGISGDSNGTMKIDCRLQLSLGSRSRMVTQMRDGEQFEPLNRLARRILSLSRETTTETTGADSLKDGLEKLETGELDPVTFNLQFHQRVENRYDPEGALGSTLTLHGRQATHQTILARPRYGEPSKLRLSEAEFAKLIRALADRGVAELPSKLYADEYNEFEVQILNQEMKIQAWKFPDIDPQEFGTRQEQFNRILTHLNELSSKVQKEGKKLR
jgi:hypothetical protein